MNPLHRAALGALLTLAASLVAAGPLAGGQLDFDIIFGDDPGGKVPSQLTWAPDGERLTYVWNDDDGEALWLLELASGQATALLRTADAKIDGHSWATDGSRRRCP